MGLDWKDERYVRLYTRDSADWLCLSFIAQGLFTLLLRKVDRAGILPLGKSGKRGVAIAIGHAHQWAQLSVALEELLEDGCVAIVGDRLVMPNFIEAQEAEASDKARSRKAREKRRDLARAGQVEGSEADQEGEVDASRNVTPCHGNTMSRDGTGTKRDEGDTGRIATVTPNHAVPSRTEKETTSSEMNSEQAVLLAAGSLPLLTPGNGRAKASGLAVTATLLPTPDASPVVASLPCVGEGPETPPFEITKAMVDEWTGSYPGVDVMAEVRKAIQYVRDRPHKRKTRRGARKFLGGWMARNQDRGGTAPPAMKLRELT